MSFSFIDFNNIYLVFFSQEVPSDQDQETWEQIIYKIITVQFIHPDTQKHLHSMLIENFKSVLQVIPVARCITGIMHF